MTTVEVTLPVASSAHQQRPWKVNKTSGKKDCKKKTATNFDNGQAVLPGRTAGFRNRRRTGSAGKHLIWRWNRKETGDFFLKIFPRSVAES